MHPGRDQDSRSTTIGDDRDRHRNDTVGMSIVRPIECEVANALSRHVEINAGME